MKLILRENMKWPETTLFLQEEKKKAIAPTIISASRATDIPAFYPQWFMNRLYEGYSKWINPFNSRPQYISFEKAKFIVFWSKNPKPLIPYLDQIQNKYNLNFYFQFTLNDYSYEGLEPNVPDLQERINTFQTLSKICGKEKVIWRFDPLILTDNIDIDTLAYKMNHVGNKISNYTNKLIFSFVDIERYKKVQNKLNKNNVKYYHFNDKKMRQMASLISQLNQKWNLQLYTCGENIDLKEYGIGHNKCIDDELIKYLSSKDKELINYLAPSKPKQLKLINNYSNANPQKDSGQRDTCGCITSKDIGQYNTCGHLCLYCYANQSDQAVKRKLQNTSVQHDQIAK